ncbi:MAG: hypothetical protein ACI9Y7_000518, partial [Dokdonia sp.]
MGNIVVKQKLIKIIEKGISFEISQDKLLIKGDLTTLTLKEKDYLKENKEAIVFLIENQDVQKLIPRVPISNEGYVLSSSQHRLWILSQFEQGNIAYNMPGVFVFEGALDY